jgi:hypothetical protein
MFEFEDDDFTLMKSFSVSDAEAGSADFEDQVLTRGTYLGDGVWVVDLQETSETIEQAPSAVSEA